MNFQMNVLDVSMSLKPQEALFQAVLIVIKQKSCSWLKKGGEIMVSAILHAAMGMMALFAFLLFLALSVVALVPILGSVYYLIADLYKWIKSKLD